MNKVSDISVARQRKERMEAYHIAESAIDVFHDVFKHSYLLRRALDGAKAIHDDPSARTTLRDHRALAQSAIDVTADYVVTAIDRNPWDLHAGMMAAYSVLLALDENLDLDAVRQKADEAFRHAPAKEA